MKYMGDKTELQMDKGVYVFIKIRIYKCTYMCLVIE